ncbi:acyl-CoA dehydrogenase family protein [Microbacterium sp. JZ31]|uniref:acyl-CoA dehydrogenase family protein n=1 Tax=Microbacterium sp. JZ31 TaxID=1906274 RepID=UPI001932B9C5|nr:acyl-CoA dehydrogenase family protein [Microbacterium sp. JZ31]
MSTAAPVGRVRPATLEEFDRELDALLIGVAERAAEQERTRTLLREDVRALQALGFGALRLPKEDGGLGATFEQLVERVVRIAAADSSLAHLYRGHIAFVEGLLGGYDSDPAHNRLWVDRIAAGDLVGNAQSERQETAQITTTLARDGERITLTGRKYYTTGSIYADWIHLSALDGEQRVGVTVSALDPGVDSVDDWDGFGQLLTGTGTTTFDRVPVDPADIVVAGEDARRGDHIASVFQIVLLAVIAGIGRAALRDTVEYVRPRRRIFGFAGEAAPRADALVQETIGAVSAASEAAVRLVLSAARDVDTAPRATAPARTRRSAICCSGSSGCSRSWRRSCSMPSRSCSRSVVRPR